MTWKSEPIHDVWPSASGPLSRETLEAFLEGVAFADQGFIRAVTRQLKWDDS